jgi:hypothetical protein
MELKVLALSLLLLVPAEAELVKFKVYPPGATVWRRGSAESYLGKANEQIEVPIPEGVTSYEVVLRHPDGEHLEKPERPSIHQAEWPGENQGEIVLQPLNLWVRIKDLVRYPTSSSYTLAAGIFVGLGFLGWRLLQVRGERAKAEESQRRAREKAAAAEQSRREQQTAQREAERRAEENRLAKVAQERERAALELRHEVLDQSVGGDPWLGLRVGSYVAVELLGKGASGRVYSGKLVQPHPTAPPLVAIKVIELEGNQPPEMHQRFLSEIDVGKLLKHPNIVGYYGATRVDKAICIFQELIAGKRTLRDLEALAPMEIPEILRWLRPVGAALDYMHGQGIYHRDLKPENVMITPEGVPKIADLGLAKNPNNLLTKTAEGYGTPAYIAPEQITAFKEADGRADQYALGCMVYQLLCGRLPFTSEQSPDSVIMLHLTQAAPAIPEQSTAVNAVVLRMLDKDRIRRFDTCGQALEALAQAQ